MPVYFALVCGCHGVGLGGWRVVDLVRKQDPTDLALLVDAAWHQPIPGYLGLVERYQGSVGEQMDFPRRYGTPGVAGFPQSVLASLPSEWAGVVHPGSFRPAV